MTHISQPAIDVHHPDQVLLGELFNVVGRICREAEGCDVIQSEMISAGT